MKDNTILLHRVGAVVSVIAGSLTSIAITRVISPVSSEAILSNAAIISTFGAALLSIAVFLLADSSAEINESIDVLFTEILKGKRWRRWPFFARRSSSDLLDGSSLIAEVKNPEIEFDVGTHEIKIDVPTVSADFYDLPVLRNFVRTVRFRKAFLTRHAKLSTEKKEDTQKYELFLCLCYVWRKIVVYRAARYLHYYSCALIFTSFAFALRVLK